MFAKPDGMQIKAIFPIHYLPHVRFRVFDYWIKLIAPLELGQSQKMKEWNNTSDASLCVELHNVWQGMVQRMTKYIGHTLSVVLTQSENKYKLHTSQMKCSLFHKLQSMSGKKMAAWRLKLCKWLRNLSCNSIARSRSTGKWFRNTWYNIHAIPINEPLLRARLSTWIHTSTRAPKNVYTFSNFQYTDENMHCAWKSLSC